MQKGLKVSDGIKVANNLTLRWGDCVIQVGPVSSKGRKGSQSDAVQGLNSPFTGFEGGGRGHEPRKVDTCRNWKG